MGTDRGFIFNILKSFKFKRIFFFQIKVVDRARERRVFEEIVRKLDKRENDSLPQVKLDKHEVSF